MYFVSYDVLMKMAFKDERIREKSNVFYLYILSLLYIRHLIHKKIVSWWLKEKKNEINCYMPYGFERLQKYKRISDWVWFKLRHIKQTLMIHDRIKNIYTFIAF